MRRHAPGLTPTTAVNTRVKLATYLLETHGICEEHGDVATAGLLEGWIDEAQQRAWHLFEVCRHVAGGES